MDNEAELDTVVRGRARKRKVNATNWKRRSTKVARNSGKEYTSTKKYVQQREVPARVVGGPHAPVIAMIKWGVAIYKKYLLHSVSVGTLTLRMVTLQSWSRVLTYGGHRLWIALAES